MKAHQQVGIAGAQSIEHGGGRFRQLENACASDGQLAVGFLGRPQSGRSAFLPILDIPDRPSCHLSQLAFAVTDRVPQDTVVEML